MLSSALSFLSSLGTPHSDANTLRGRSLIAKDTLARTSGIVSSTPGASSSSTFLNDETCPELSPLDHAPYPSSNVMVINADSFKVARDILRNDTGAKVAVLNLASDEYPGGGWTLSLCRTQEEALCYSSTLYHTLTPSLYPWPNVGPGSIAGIYSPSIVVFKDDLDHNCTDLPEDERVIVGVMTVAAPRNPKLMPDKLSFARESDLQDLRGKIRLILRMAGHDGKDSLVLGAMGCGAYRCPPEFVARQMKDVISEEEFRGRFKRVVFAVYSSADNGPSNFRVFQEVYEGFVINE